MPAALALAVVVLAGCGNTADAPQAAQPSSPTVEHSSPVVSTAPTYPPGRPLPDDVLDGFPLDIGMEAPEGWRKEGPGPSVGPLPNDVDLCGDWISWPSQDVEPVERLRANLYGPDERLVEERDLFRHSGVRDAVAVMRDLRGVLEQCPARGAARWLPMQRDPGHDSATAALTARGSRDGSVFQWTRAGNVVFMVRLTRPDSKDGLDDLADEVTTSSRRIADELVSRR